MTWVKLDDGFYRNRKARLAGKDGRALFLAGLCHCSNALTDGHIGTYDLPVIAAEAEVKPGVADKLVSVGLWTPVDDGWIVHDYGRWNRSATDVRKERDEGRDRAARSRERNANAPPNGARTFANGSGDKSKSSGPSGLHQSSSSNLVRDWAEDDDDDWPKLVAKRRGARREAEVGKVGNRKKWLVTTVNDVLDEHKEAADFYLSIHPGATAVAVADYLEPGAETARRRAEQERSCELCEGRGVIENDDGTVSKCDHNLVP